MRKVNRSDFSQWLQERVATIGAHSAACLRMDNPELKRCIQENHRRVADWLKTGLHGEMTYLERMAGHKANPWRTFSFARSVIVLAFTNRWGDPAATHPFPPPSRGAILGYISAYAKEIDYHARGRALLAQLKDGLGPGIRAETAVDTKAVYERLLARVGGLGVIGANDLLRVPDRTSVRVFIGCLFVSVELPEVIREAHMPFACADCLACVKRCPTGAIQRGEPIDARRCISYLTIEKRSVLSRPEAEMIEDWLFGCDGCTVVCPPRDRVDTRIPVDLEWLLKTPAKAIERRIRDNATSYAGVRQLRKNAVVLLKKNPLPQAKALLQWTRDHTGSDLVRQQIDQW